MPYATKEKHNNHCKKYYHEKGLKDIQTQRAKKNRWIKKYEKFTGKNPKIFYETLTTDDIKEFVLREEQKNAKNQL